MKPFMGYKDCLKPHNCAHATGIQPDFTWQQNLCLVVAAVCFTAAILLAKGIL